VVGSEQDGYRDEETREDDKGGSDRVAFGRTARPSSGIEIEEIGVRMPGLERASRDGKIIR
jgi:hypothetical protein